MKLPEEIASLGPVIVVFTGSRDLSDQAYFDHCEDLVVTEGGLEIHKAFVGDCPTGLDRWVRQDLACFGVTHEVFRAQWYPDGRLDRSAGPKRNEAMVRAAKAAAAEAGLPLVCVALPMGASRGTRDCMRRAEKAGAKMMVTEVKG